MKIVEELFSLLQFYAVKNKKKNQPGNLPIRTAYNILIQKHKNKKGKTWQ